MYIFSIDLFLSYTGFNSIALLKIVENKDQYSTIAITGQKNTSFLN